MVRFELTYPDNITGGLMLFGGIMIIGIVELYIIRKANQASIVLPGMMKHVQAQRDSGIRVCKAYGGIWRGRCCWRPKRRLQRSIRKCS